MPIEPHPTPWRFPDLNGYDGDDLVAVGADLEPGTILHGYRHGFFPMPVGDGDLTGWWSPDPRGVLELDALRVSRSLRASRRRFDIRMNTVFDQVIDRCGDPDRPHGWINDAVAAAYIELHHLGWAHSIEAWDDDGLAGGLYGVSIGGLFAGESMFHSRRDASKVCLVALVDHLNAQRDGDALIDVQWRTDHLESLGVREVSRQVYVDRLPHLIASKGPTWPEVLRQEPKGADTGVQTAAKDGLGHQSLRSVIES